MCTLLLAIDQHPRYQLILAANRDEYYQRPTAAAAFWEDAPTIFAGRDLARGGTWLGVTATGRIAALTNYREPHQVRQNAPSRGELPSDFLRQGPDPREYLQRLRAERVPYSGFNLVVGGPDRLFYYSSKTDQVLELSPGLYGLSNHLLDTPWPKVRRGKEGVARLLAGGEFSAEDLFGVLADPARPPDEELPDTGVGLDWERVLSSIYIRSERYGTRSSTVLLVDRERQATFIERSFDGGVRDTVRRLDWSGSGK